MFPEVMDFVFTFFLTCLLPYLFWLVLCCVMCDSCVVGAVCQYRLRDWLGRMSLKWPILCWVRHKPYLNQYHASIASHGKIQFVSDLAKHCAYILTTGTLLTHNTTTVLRLCGICPGKPGWAGTRRTFTHYSHRSHQSSLSAFSI